MAEMVDDSGNYDSEQYDLEEEKREVDSYEREGLIVFPESFKEVIIKKYGDIPFQTLENLKIHVMKKMFGSQLGLKLIADILTKCHNCDIWVIAKDNCFNCGEMSKVNIPSLLYSTVKGCHTKQLRQNNLVKVILCGYALFFRGFSEQIDNWMKTLFSFLGKGKQRTN